MPGVGRNSYKAAMKKAKAKTNKKKTPLKNLREGRGGAKKRTSKANKVGPGGQSPNKSKNAKVQAIKKNMKNTTMPSRSSGQNNKRKKISTRRVYGPVKRK
tara:strand:- start:697 stop:999 length:303 start_codon:yes stop_codon:yes gene_type:complete